MILLATSPDIPQLLLAITMDQYWMTKSSFPLIAKANLQARCENFHPVTIFESTRYELAPAMSGKEALLNANI